MLVSCGTRVRNILFVAGTRVSGKEFNSVIFERFSKIWLKALTIPKIWVMEFSMYK